MSTTTDLGDTPVSRLRRRHLERDDPRAEAGLREPASVLFAMVQPLVFLGLFAPLLPEVRDGSALQWFVPGIVAMTA